MRRFIASLAVTAALATTAMGHAAPGALPATCGGSAPAFKACSYTFTLSEPTAITLRLAPDIGFTGSLVARVVVNDASQVTKATVGGYYVAGQATPLAPNYYTEISGLVLPAGSYKLIANAAKLLTICAGACAPIPQADTIAAGAWQAELFATDSPL